MRQLFQTVGAYLRGLTRQYYYEFERFFSKKIEVALLRYGIPSITIGAISTLKYLLVSILNE